MASATSQWRESWHLREDEVISTAQGLERLDYSLEWRQWLWRRPARELLAPFEQFRGKRVLELGSRYGRMSCLLAAAGAQVTGVDTKERAKAISEEEARRWGVEKRCNFVVYNGDCRTLPKATYDFIFTKSVLVMIPHVDYQHCLEGLCDSLAPGGVGLFLENVNSRFINWVRHNVTYRGDKEIDLLHWGFFPSDIEHLRTMFGPMQVRKYLGLIWAMRTVGNTPPASGPRT
jgi:SAM-dependent methyltransferase